MTLSIRGRLTLWYTTVLSLVLVAFAAFLYWIHARSNLALVDEELAGNGALVARIMPTELEEGLELAQAAQDALEDIEIPSRSLAIFDAGGVLLSGHWEGLPHPTELELREPSDLTVATPTGPFRLHLAEHQYGDTTYRVGVAESLAPLNRELAGLRRTLLGSVLVSLLLAAGGGFWLAHVALRPVAMMAAQALRITDRTPGFRLTSPNPRDELGVLAGAFNDLLRRLESALSQGRQFMADASHELRTPVSISRTAIEVALSRDGRDEAEYRDSLAVVAGQMRRLSRVVEDMFTLARADATGLPLDRRPLYLDELVGDCVKETAVLAAPKGVTLDWRGASDVEATGDEQRLRQMLVNLLDNAIRHTSSGGRVQVELMLRTGAAEIAVTDSGAGVPEVERKRIFERFVRLDPSRRPGEGAGLGLPIARAIAEAHGGSLLLARSDGSGSTFLVRLPLPHPPEGASSSVHAGLDTVSSPSSNQEEMRHDYKNQ